MGDPLSAAGLALSALALPAQLFSSCVAAYAAISDSRELGSSSNKLFWLFKIQETRFLVWGQNCDMYGCGLNPDDLSTIVYETIVSTLVQISELLQDVSRLCRIYGLQPLGQTQSAEPSRFNRELQRQSTMVFRVQRSCSLFAKMRLAVKDQSKFSELVRQLTAFNDSLYQFRPLTGDPSLTVAVQAETLSQTLVNDGLPGVQILQRTATQAAEPQLEMLRSMSAALVAAT